MGKYLSVTWHGIRHERQSPAATIGRIGFYTLLIVIFFCLWGTIESEKGGAIGRDTILWYLIVTEWIMLSLPQIHLAFEEDYKHGDVYTHMLRPMSYIGMRLSYAIGVLSYRLAMTGVAGVIIGLLAAGAPTHGISALVGAFLMGSFAAVLLLIFQGVLGLSAFWLHDATPIYWVWQKGNFVLGGLMVPLFLYPEWMQSVALFTPFYACMYNSGRVVLEGVEVLGITMPLLGVWYVVAFTLLRRVSRNVERHLLEGQL